MSLDQSTPPLDVQNVRVFDYQRDVIVELHGETADGEFDAVSYVFRNDPGGAGLRPPEIADAHETAVHEALDDEDYTIT